MFWRAIAWSTHIASSMNHQVRQRLLQLSHARIGDLSVIEDQDREVRQPFQVCQAQHRRQDNG